MASLVWIHRFNVFFKPTRGGKHGRAELAVAVYNDISLSISRFRESRHECGRYRFCRYGVYSAIGITCDPESNIILSPGLGLGLSRLGCR